MEDHFSFLLWTVQMEIKVQVDFLKKNTLQLFYSNSEQYFFITQ